MATIDNADDLRIMIYHQYGARLAEGETAAQVQITNITADAAFTNWGIITTAGNADIQDGVSYQVYSVGPAVLLVDGALPNFDLQLAGVNNTYNPITVYMNFDGAGGDDPIVYEFSITERIDYIVFSTDGESCYTAISDLAAAAGADFWVENNGDGTYMVHFSTRRGEDKSSWLILKCASTTDKPNVAANVKVLSTTYDWSDFANSILFIGGVSDTGDRVEVEVQDTDDVIARDQPYWITIRDASVTTTALGRTLAALELNKRNSVVIRIMGEFVDKNDSNDISIGDSVNLIGEWSDADLKIEGSHRIVRLSRSWGTGGGERVSAEFTNRMKPAQYYNYIQKIDSLERVSVQ